MLQFALKNVRVHAVDVAVAVAGLLGLAIGWLAGSWLVGLTSLVIVAAFSTIRWSYKKALRRTQRAREKAKKLLAASDEEQRDTRTASDETEDPADLIDLMLEQKRFALLLRPQIVSNLSEAQIATALEELDDSMALTPPGPVMLHTWRAAAELDGDAEADEHIVRVESYYLDRYPVTNRQYQVFVDDGGYEQMSLWDPDIWSGVLDFVDQTGHAGPEFWEDGRFPRGKADHPVVGVCWYEAAAYARWAGKRLPTDAEWVKAAAWPVGSGKKPIQRKYPWGDSMDHRMANLWGTLVGDTVPVNKFDEGISVGGVYQLIGNVWEWTHSNFGAWDEAARRIELSGPMKAIRGAAFDTYFDGQATCQFQSGDSSLARKHNIGFRCAVGLCDLSPNFAEAFGETASTPSTEGQPESHALEAAV